eukprot:2553493-Amphidinium_carterae.1
MPVSEIGQSQVNDRVPTKLHSKGRAVAIPVISGAHRAVPITSQQRLFSALALAAEGVARIRCETHIMICLHGTLFEVVMKVGALVKSWQSLVQYGGKKHICLMKIKGSWSSRYTTQCRPSFGCCVSTKSTDSKHWGELVTVEYLTEPSPDLCTQSMNTVGFGSSDELTLPEAQT